MNKTKAFNLPVEEVTAHPDVALGHSLPRATAVSLKTPHGETVGLLCLLSAAAPDPSQIELSQERLAFVETLARVAAVAIDNQRLFKTQKELPPILASAKEQHSLGSQIASPRLHSSSSRKVTVQKPLDVNSAAQKWIRSLPQRVLRSWPA